MKLAIITTHPVQYYAPIFQLLHQRKNITIKVYYTAGETGGARNDPGFGKKFEWDIPLLDGYPYQWVKNIAADPGSHHTKGIVNPDLIEQLNSWSPDALLIYGWNYVSHLQVMRAFKNKIPIYFRGDSTLLDRENPVKAILKRLYLHHRVYNNIDHAFYTGLNNKAYFKQYGLKEWQLSFAPHAIDNDRFAQNRDAEVQALKQSLNINNEAIVILFAGKLEAKKAPDLLLNTFLQINRPFVHLIFTGNGDMEDTLKAKAAQNMAIHFLDFQNQSVMPVVYQACDIFCLPSRGPGETWGLAVNEAMACGKAILLSDKVGCAINLAVDNKNGYIFTAANEKDLKNNLLKLIDTGKKQLTAMGKQSAQIIASWNFEAQVKCMEDVMLNKRYE